MFRTMRSVRFGNHPFRVNMGSHRYAEGMKLLSCRALTSILEVCIRTGMTKEKKGVLPTKPGTDEMQTPKWHFCPDETCRTWGWPPMLNEALRNENWRHNDPLKRSLTYRRISVNGIKPGKNTLPRRMHAIAVMRFHEVIVYDLNPTTPSLTSTTASLITRIPYRHWWGYTMCETDISRPGRSLSAFSNFSMYSNAVMRVLKFKKIMDLEMSVTSMWDSGNTHAYAQRRRRSWSVCTQTCVWFSKSTHRYCVTHIAMCTFLKSSHSCALPPTQTRVLRITVQRTHPAIIFGWCTL